MTIIARKPRTYPDGSIGNLFATPLEEYVVIDLGENVSPRYASASYARTFNSVKIEAPTKVWDWYDGHYFATAEEALAHFNAR